jgi:hypothetical protein
MLPVQEWVTLAGEGVLAALIVVRLLRLDVGLPAAVGIGALGRISGLWLIQQLDPMITAHSPEDVVVGVLVVSVLLGVVQLVRGN